MVTAAKVAPKLLITHKYFITYKYQVQQSTSPNHLLDHLCQEIVVNVPTTAPSQVICPLILNSQVTHNSTQSRTLCISTALSHKVNSSSLPYSHSVLPHKISSPSLPSSDPVLPKHLISFQFRTPVVLSVSPHVTPKRLYNTDLLFAPHVG